MALLIVVKDVENALELSFKSGISRLIFSKERNVEFADSWVALLLIEVNFSAEGRATGLFSISHI